MCGHRENGRHVQQLEEEETMISACRAMIAWNSENRNLEAPQGAVGIGPYFGRGEADWTEPYDCTGGAAYVFRRELSGVEQDFHVMRDFYMLIHDYGLDPRLVQRAFLELDEFQTIISAMRRGPNKDEPGLEPEVEHERCYRNPMPKLQIFERLGAVHVWPAPVDRAIDNARAEVWPRELRAG
jgi:hypothetical protein